MNKLLIGELTSVYQCLPHSLTLKENRINKLAEKIKNKLDEELEHANKQAKRTLLLKSVPNFQDTNEILKYEGNL
ncbi:ferritin-like domain-containing protein [Wolbachia endosymbiont of Litomosoides brasiliensis]|uniref:ferritin-like domain-containing protein n=1 Tax=Wolbachia endosymbiont of Litomosoides brasiliensis TaxID=1812117 RepID=UPI001FE8E345|nr:ferritin-like domain-containing protein [Wolbachia endosymbiont of Litomosoides brasiliensis]